MEFDDKINVNSIGDKLKNCFIHPIVVGDIDEIERPFAVTNKNTDKRVKPMYQINIIHRIYVNKQKNKDNANIKYGLIHDAVKNVHKILPINIGIQ
jgi:hypothetical protein